jgi:phosphoribosylamine--glycine ligase
MPIVFRGPLSPDDRANIHYGEVALRDGSPVVAGPSGYVLVATGAGSTIDAARIAAYDLIERIVVPNGRYRIDIGERLANHDAQVLRQLGYLPQHRA